VTKVRMSSIKIYSYQFSLCSVSCVVNFSSFPLHKPLMLVVRSAEEWSRMMAFFYYKAVRPPFLSEADEQRQEKVPLMS
jgi:hypothetical protein